MRFLKIGQVSQESVGFQSLDFFKELTLVYKELKAVNKKELADHEGMTRIGKIIANYTNLNITVELNEHGPAVDVPMIDKNNILINSFNRNHINSADGIKMVNSANGVARGSVNLQTGKVTGIFTEVNSRIYMPASMILSDKYEAEEMAAVTLHEVGHLVTYYEFITRTVTTNQVLAGMAKGLDGSGNIQEREAVLVSVKKAMNLKDLNTSELAKSNSRKVAEIVVVTNITKEARAELGTNIYDFSTWEYLADEYAARHGASRYLVTALDKLFRGYGNISFRSTPMYLAMEALKIAILIANFYMAGQLTGLAILLFTIDGSGDGTYDRPGARMQRIRHQIIENLKDTTLPKNDLQRLSDDLAIIDSVTESVNDRRQWLGVLWDSLIPSARTAYKQEKQQQELEAIATNELFQKASELRQLA